MAQATQDPVIVAAQERLMQKRATLSQTEHHGQRIGNIDFNAVAERCLKKASETANVLPWKEQEEKAIGVKQKTKTAGWIDGAPKAYRECTFENYHGNDKLIKDLQRFIGASWDGIVLRGNTGCGKTHLASAIVNYQYQANKPALFIFVPEFLDHLRSAFNPDSKISYDQLFEKVKNTPLLVLDDFGEQAATPWARSRQGRRKRSPEWRVYRDPPSGALPACRTTRVGGPSPSESTLFTAGRSLIR